MRACTFPNRLPRRKGAALPRDDPPMRPTRTEIGPDKKPIYKAGQFTGRSTLRGNLRAKCKLALAAQPGSTPQKGLERAIYSRLRRLISQSERVAHSGCYTSRGLYEQNEGRHKSRLSLRNSFFQPSCSSIRLKLWPLQIPKEKTPPAPDIAPIRAAGRANGNESNVTRLDLDVRGAAPEESPVKAMRFGFAGVPVSRQGADIVGRRSPSRSLYHLHQSAGGICATKASKERKEIIRVSPCCYLARVLAMVILSHS